MGYVEAVEDGVRITGGNGKQTFYHPKCKFCNAEITRMSYVRGYVYTCPECKQKLEAMKDNHTKQKKERQFNSALRIFKNRARLSGILFSDYKAAVEVVRSCACNEGLFGSKEEILVAFVLEKAGIVFQQQKKVIVYYLDFVLPELHIVLEVDGELYHNYYNQEKDRLRDEDVKMALGAEWTIVRLSDYEICRSIFYIPELLHKISQGFYPIAAGNNYDAECSEIHYLKEMERLSK